MKARRKTLPPKLELIAESINEAVSEARKVKELAVQEGVLTSWKG